MRIIILNIMIVMLVACSSTGKDSAAAKAQKLEITFSQSACFGKCKVFKMMLNNNQVFLDAVENTPMVGEFTSELDAGELDTLKDYVINNNLFQNSEVEMHDQDITDLPYCTMTIKLGDKQKTIKYRNRAPMPIRDIDVFLRGIILELHRWESKK